LNGVGYWTTVYTDGNNIIDVTNTPM
jgi:hypothetical protein